MKVIPEVTFLSRNEHFILCSSNFFILLEANFTFKGIGTDETDTGYS